MSNEHSRYSRLANLTKMINTKLELREVLQHVVTAISEEIVSCDSVGIYLPEGDGTYRGYVGKPEVLNGMTLDMHVVDPEEDPLAKEVINTQKSVYIADTARDNRPDQNAVNAFEIKSLLVTPISYADELYGLVFLFDYGIPMDLTDTEIQTVEAYVNMAAVAIRNAETLTRKEKLLSDKQLLLDVTRELSLSSTIQEVLDKCFHYVGQILENPNIGAHLLDPIADKKIKPAKLSHHSDWTEKDWKETHQKVQVDFSNDQVFQEVIQSKKPVYISDVTQDSRPSQEACKEFGIKGVLMMPLRSMGSVLGTIAVVNLNQVGRIYQDSDLQLAQSIVDTTASVLANLLYMEKQEEIIEERTSELQCKNEELSEVVHELQRLSRENEMILNSAGEGIFGLDNEGTITFCNPAASQLLGYERKEELIGQHYAQIFYRFPEKASAEDNDIEKIASMEHFGSDEKFFRQDGSEFPVEYIVAPIRGEGEEGGFVVTFKDITFRKQMEEKVKYHAYYDSVTNLPNRVLLKDRLEQAINYAQLHEEQLAVLFLDLDRFKNINDTFGHSYGDLLLEQVANRLEDSVRKVDTVSRQGGDEFTIILPNIQYHEEIESISERILHSFARPFDLNGMEVFASTSIGISVYPHDSEDPEVLIKNADTAMYKSKELSGNKYQFYTKDMDFNTMENVKIENALYKALSKDEFRIFYQPQMEAHTHRVVGVEALIRWEHPTMGMISPGEFIPIAEETGLIIPIGEWVLQNACHQIKEWESRGYDGISVSVNLSARQFKQRNLVSVVKGALKDTGVDPRHLELELTENIIIQNTDETIKTMKELKELGIQISIDDFGTGYSSLGYLKNFPISTLKIDKSFVADVLENSNNEAITHTIITLAHNLDLKVIAEGVETKEQLDFLTSKDCDFLQGYYFSKPIPADEFEKKYFE
ncbi:EAL domain-containing protein [Pontibacillus yanchengensis]|uniref:Histidine kinase n=1 Tax=Pontibacillus yanchengensis Y32 TaxID=1385514 RepID=A0A0A2TZC6_9BACI|nr:EAL domain-containing protein [Pontibacillus yanchengensis]KGP74630.1 histidine kinase [Pontibacillus yanchengensis Y32]